MRLAHNLRAAYGARIAAAAIVGLVSAAPSIAARAQAPKPVVSAATTKELDAARAGLEKYRDPIAAVRDGYFSTLGCVEYPKGGGHGNMAYGPGGMGVHFLNGQLVGPKLDPAKPQVLIYEPVGDKLTLVAAEWFVPVPVAGATRPKIFGQELQGPMEGHAPVMPPELHHYDLHVWLWKTNPAGVFSSTNPAVKCPKSAYSFAEEAPKMVAQPKQ
jgi:hypothetical protein